MDISDEQSRNNSMSREAWELFGAHRARVTDLICNAAGKLPPAVLSANARPSLAIFGGGNGNDLDVERLLENFGQIHVFDLDSTALEHFRERHCQNALAKKVIQIEPAIDLSGIATELEQYPQDATDAVAEALAHKARGGDGMIDGRQFDVVVSTCMLSQLIDCVLKSVGDEHRHKNFLMIAIRDGHLKLMAKAVRAQGWGLVITDFVSSDTLPELHSVDNESVLAIAQKAIEDRNFFTGTLPWAIKDSLAKMLTESAQRPWGIHSPWKWEIGPKRSYLVTAIEFAKSF